MNKKKLIEVFSEISDVFETECKREKMKQDFLTEILEEVYILILFYII